MARSSRLLAEMLRDEWQMDGTPTSALSDIFEREPVPLQVFISDQAYMRHPPLSPIQFDFIHQLEMIYLPETYIAMVEQFGPEWVMPPMKHMLIAQWGKGAGKDSMCRLGVQRAADLLMCLKSPQEYYGLPEHDDIHLLNVAASADQARRAFFSPMKRSFTKNKHLQTFFRNGTVPGEQAINIQLEKGIELISGNSMADTQEGMNLLVGIADEISAFKTVDELAKRNVEGRESKTAEGIVKMLRTSARTRFPRCFKVAQISYPRFAGDAIQQATVQGLASIKREGSTSSSYYVSGPYATWEVNPRVKEEDFAEDFREDPEMSDSKYRCRPPKAVNRFMRDDFMIAQAFSREIDEEPIEVEYYWGLPSDITENALAPDEVEGWQVRFNISESLIPMDGALYALHGDLGITGDAAGIAMSHVRTHNVIEPVKEGEVAERRPVIKNDFVFSFKADLAAVNPDGDHAPREVQIRWYRQLIWTLMARGFNVGSVTFDGFQSADMIQIFTSRGVASKKLSLDRNDEVYQEFKQVVYDQRLESYYRPYVMEEIRTLRRTPQNKIDHIPNGHKDEADALAGSVFGAIQIGGSEGDEPTRREFDDFFASSLEPLTATLGGHLGFGGDSGMPGFGGSMGELAFG